MQSRIHMVYKVIVSTAFLALSACATVPGEADATPPASTELAKASTPEKSFAKNDEFVVLITQPGDTLETLAERYLGNKNHAWIIGSFNGVTRVDAGQEIAIPLVTVNPVGVRRNGYQVVPVLCYHRFGKGHPKLSVETSLFRKQMQYLRDNGYQVVAMKELVEFIRGKQALPPKSVVVTIDDGYASTYDEAFPVFREFGLPATVFLYTDFIGAKDALSWEQVREMYQTGLIDFQPHSKTHPNLSLRQPDETEDEYQKRIAQEVEASKSRIEKTVNVPMHTFAYPFGDANEFVIETVKKEGFSLGVTVQPGSNPAFSSYYLLRRTMVFGDFSDKEFIASLKTFEPVDLR